jgi:hypothetical protein
VKTNYRVLQYHAVLPVVQWTAVQTVQFTVQSSSSRSSPDSQPSSPVQSSYSRLSVQNVWTVETVSPGSPDFELEGRACRVFTNVDFRLLLDDINWLQPSKEPMLAFWQIQYL